MSDHLSDFRLPLAVNIYVKGNAIFAKGGRVVLHVGLLAKGERLRGRNALKNCEMNQFIYKLAKYQCLQLVCMFFIHLCGVYM